MGSVTPMFYWETMTEKAMARGAKVDATGTLAKNRATKLGAIATAGATMTLKPDGTRIGRPGERSDELPVNARTMNDAWLRSEIPAGLNVGVCEKRRKPQHLPQRRVTTRRKGQSSTNVDVLIK